MKKVTEKINNANFLDDYENYLKTRYGDDFYNKLMNLENISLKDFKGFCNDKKTMIFLNSQGEVEIAIIKEIIKLFSGKEKYYYLKYLWGFIKNDYLSNIVLQVLKSNIPNAEELEILERLSPPMYEGIENLRRTTLSNVGLILKEGF